MTFEWTSRDRRFDVQTRPPPQTAEWHLGSRLPIIHRPIKGIHVATGNGRDQLAFDLPYSCTQLHWSHQAPGSDYFSDGAHVHLLALSDGWTSSPNLMSYTWKNIAVSLPRPLTSDWNAKRLTSAFQTEEVNCFWLEDARKARRAKSVTFPNVPVALFWSNGDPASPLASSRGNVQK